MADDKLKTLDLGLPGVLGIHEDQDGKLSILDGQHRVGMFDTLTKKKANAAGDLLRKVLVEVYPQLDHHGENHARELFLEINKAEPIKLVDLPGTYLGMAATTKCRLLREANSTLRLTI